MNENTIRKRYEGAVRLLPYSMRERALLVKDGLWRRGEEFRLRCGEPLMLLTEEREISLGGDRITKKELEAVLEFSTGASVYACREQLRKGYITAKGGYRIGVCGSVSAAGGEVMGFTSVSSVNIRIPRELFCVSDKPLGEILSKGFASTLIVSPPGAGKTTLLRDMVCSLSDGRLDGVERRIGLADERSELAGFAEGKAQLYVGRKTDILDGCPKDKAINMLLRSMNPEIIAVDEITDEKDVRAIIGASHCGVQVLATAHASVGDELMLRPIYRELMEQKIFTYLIFIERNGTERSYRVAKADKLEAGIHA